MVPELIQPFFLDFPVILEFGWKQININWRQRFRSSSMDFNITFLLLFIYLFQTEIERGFQERKDRPLVDYD